MSSGDGRSEGATPPDEIVGPSSAYSVLRGWLGSGGMPARPERIFRITANLVGAAGAAYFAEVTLQGFRHNHRFIGAVFLVEQTWVVIAYLIRRPSRTTNRRLGDWLLAFGGTFGGVLFRPDGAHLRWGLDLGLGAQLLGLAVCIASFLALGRSFGFVAADRGLVSRGPYAVVRHPIYASYVVLQLGYVLQSLSVRNALVMVFASGCNVGRAIVEDRALSTGSHYAEYRDRVRWRLLPGVW
jgi:protein-S-isoprenylcysteine O-methyltransferase Ste14